MSKERGDNMERQTRMFFTLEVTKTGRSGPQNERDIERLVERLQRELSKGKTDVTIGHHDYDTVTETLD